MIVHLDWIPFQLKLILEKRFFNQVLVNNHNESKIGCLRHITLLLDVVSINILDNTLNPCSILWKT